MNETKILFQNLSFNSRTSLENKKKINHMSFYLRNNKILTCFNLFELSSFNCIQISFQMVIYIMMLIKVIDI